MSKQNAEERIVLFMVGKPEVSIQEIIKECIEYKPITLRIGISNLTKEERVEGLRRGVYKLKDGVSLGFALAAKDIVVPEQTSTSEPNVIPNA